MVGDATINHRAIVSRGNGQCFGDLSDLSSPASLLAKRGKVADEAYHASDDGGGLEAPHLPTKIPPRFIDGRNRVCYSPAATAP